LIIGWFARRNATWFKPNDSAKHDSQMHLPNLPKEKLPIAPRTLKELSLQFNPSLLLNKYLKTVSLQIACVT
jgi:hypothetical protein